VNQLASEGRMSRETMQACLLPVYQLSPDSVAQLYPDVRTFNQGIQTLQESFDSAGLRQHRDVVRYLLGMLVLQQHLNRQPAMQSAIGQRISQLAASQQTGLDDLPDQALQADCAALARLYQDTISTLSFRVHVAGNPEHLRNPQVAEQIRALLFAGIRSAVLWHQLGGRRWQLFFYKKRIRESLSSIRRKLMTLN
jgi:high frequency lysogenization protein